jgi:saposin
VCEKLPVGVRDLCKHFVEAYLPKLIELLIQKQPPEVVCKELGLCPKHMEEEETNGVSCELCKMVVEEAKKLIKDYSEKGVKEALEKVCDFLPPILSGACKVFVDKYSDKLIDMLLKKMSAEAICKSLGLCHKSVENGVSCTLCQFVIMEVEKLLHDERTEESIIKALDRVCHRLPPALRDECSYLVKTYLPLLIELLIQKQPPEVVCKEIGLCPKRMGEEAKNGVSCELCKMVVDEAKKQIKDYSEQGVKEALGKVCHHLPPLVSGACKSFVEKYSSKLVEMLLKKLPTDVICKNLGLCSKSLQNGVGHVAAFSGY